MLVSILLADFNGRPLRISHSVLLGYFCGVVWYLGNCSWIYQTMHLYGGMAKPIAFGILILFSLYLGLYHALFAFLLAVIRRSRFQAGGALLAAPFLWVAVELARGRVTGFPWDLLGYSQTDNLFLTRIAPLAGVISMSFVIVSINAALSAYFFVPGRRRPMIPAVGAVLAVLLQFVAPAQVNAPSAAGAPAAVMLQENLVVGAMAKEVEPISAADELHQFSQMTLGQASRVTPSILLWPEAPSHLQSNDQSFRTSLGALARAAHAPAIVGSLGVDLTSAAPRGYFLYDSASLFDAEGSYKGRYDKIHRVPWGEYIPFKPFFGYFVHKLTEGAG